MNTMKYFCFFCVMALSTVAFSQSQSVRLYVHLKYEDETPYANSLVYLKNLSNNEVEEFRTDTQGKFKYRLATKTTYELQLKKDKVFSTIKVPKKTRSLITKTYTIPKKDYPTYPSDSIYQNINPRTTLPSNAFAIAEIFVGDREQKPVRKVEVRLFDRKTKKTYITKSTNSGTAFFRIPNNTTYDVSIVDLENYKVIKIPNKPDTYFRTGFPFVPTNITETITKDTVRQELPTKVQATSSRAWVRILVKNYDDEPLANEQITLNPRGDSLTYLGFTNDRGIAEFLLPVGKQYILHFYYERNIDLLDFRVKGGLHRSNIQYTYMGTEAIQTFYREAQRDNFGFLKEFREVPIQPFVFKEKDYIEQTENGYNIDFKKDKGPINTPTVIDGKIYTNAGYYSRNLYVFDEKTGKFDWGVELTEGGPSSLVYENGILLVITQSCTLYAIDAKSGKLIWSKYLAPNMYSTPSVANGKVIATFPRGLNLKERFVLGCFDLKTGEIDWQKSMDAEAISSPIIHNDKIYTATRSGKLYRHDFKSGERLQMDSINATTPPTIVDNSIYIGILKNKKEQHLVKFSTDDFSKKTVLKNLSSSFEEKPHKAYLRMSFDGIRPLHKAGKNYLIANNQLICSDKNGQIIWKSILNSTTENTSKYSVMPIISDNTIIATAGNSIQLFNATTGNSIKNYEIKGEALTQPTLQNGIIYSGSNEQRMITIDTKNKKLTGWNMWSGNGSHNTVIEN